MFIGHEEILNNIRIYANAFGSYSGKVNLLITGLSGFGKTTLAKKYAEMTGRPYRIILGGQRPFRSDVLIIDEAHLSTNPEIYYPIMDDEDRSVVLTTTHLGRLAEPFWNRCIHIEIPQYSNESLVAMVNYYSKNFFDQPVINLIINRTRGVPRVVKEICNRLLLHIYAGDVDPSLSSIEGLITSFGYYPGGFTQYDKAYINFLYDVEYASLNTLSGYLSLPKVTIQEYIEPYLIKGWFIEITSKGRRLTERGKTYVQTLRSMV